METLKLTDALFLYIVPLFLSHIFMAINTYLYIKKTRWFTTNDMFVLIMWYFISYFPVFNWGFLVVHVIIFIETYLNTKNK